jgi:hypothetical protein
VRRASCSGCRPSIETTICRRGNRRPLGRDRPDGAGDDLGVDAARGQLRQDVVQLAEPDERLAADDRDVNRLLLVDHGEDAIDEFLPL